MSKLLMLALLLLVIWVVARVVLAVTGLMLHLLWIAALVLAAIWLIQKVRGK